MSKTKLVIVESPTKAKTIRKFLGADYAVESCMGHVRDLPQSSKDIPAKFKKEKWAQLGVNVDKKFEPLYCIPKDKVKIVKNLREKLEDADELFLATDEDREGESISWHLTEVLKPKVPMKRMVFHEITKEAIQAALKNTRAIDQNLVKAQEARRVLDRLVGYTISPLLWKKVAYGLSAGRVQSVAVRMIVEKELDRLKFKKSAYSGVAAEFAAQGKTFEAKLIQTEGKKVATGKDFDGLTGKLINPKDFLILDPKKAQALAEDFLKRPFEVSEVEEKPVSRKPSPPFITSTLQQESNRKLGLSSRETMQVAQKLYEQGFITYMRTDSIFLSKEAIDATRAGIQKLYGKEYLPAAPRTFEGKKAKGAQEAHEAIRPAGTSFQLPEKTDLLGMQAKLYDLIWKRTMASQMVDAKQKQVSVKILNGKDLFSASGMTIEFPGFLRAYVEGSDDPEADLQEREVILPTMKVKEKLQNKKFAATEHETKPPARFTEASLVQTMEKEGIGRPSTYASIIGTIIDRGYVRKAGTALTPTFTAMVVSDLLKKYLPKYVDLQFTSKMEESLDEIADGELDQLAYLKQIYLGDDGLKKLVETQEKNILPEEARTIELFGLKDFKFHVGRYGAYFSTIQKNGEPISATIPDSEAPSDTTVEYLNKLIEQKINGTDALGKDPKTKLPVYVLSGRYGPYVQLGDIGDEKEKPKRQGLPPGTNAEDVTLEQALKLLELPAVVGAHPDTKVEIKKGLGRFGPYLLVEGEFRSIPKTYDFFGLTLEDAVEILKTPKKGKRGSQSLKEWEVKAVPKEKIPDKIQLMSGPYGKYLKVGKKNVGLPKDIEPEKWNAEEVVKFIKENRKE